MKKTGTGIDAVVADYFMLYGVSGLMIIRLTRLSRYESSSIGRAVLVKAIRTHSLATDYHHKRHACNAAMASWRSLYGLQMQGDRI